MGGKVLDKCHTNVAGPGCNILLEVCCGELLLLALSSLTDRRQTAVVISQPT
jgi:hypothetical protein